VLATFPVSRRGRTTAFQLAQAVGAAVGVAVVGRPTSATAALDAYRWNWLVSAALFAVLFAVAYPGRAGAATS